MGNDGRVLRLLETLMESGGEPEDLCTDCPELLPDLREQWDQCRRLDARIDALFGDSDEESCADAPSTDAADSDTGYTSESSFDLPAIPGYEVLALEGRGGMGVVYRARHLKLNRIIALKMLVTGVYSTSVERVRFLREAQAVAALRHPNIVQVHDVGELDGRPYFTMEFVDGKTLAHKLAGVPQPTNQAVAIALSVADAVQSAHASGIIHRDLKPANILLTEDGTLKISDFGLAWRIEGADALTIAGTRLGTPSYMAPEQAFSGAGTIGPATDVYALGAILYEMLAGRPPFRGESPAETERQLLADDPVLPAKLNPRVSRDLQTICMTCLQKDPRRRYQSAAAMADDLRRLQRGEPISARRTRVIERSAKWARRHPAITTVLAFTALVLLSGIAAMTWAISQRNASNKVVEEQLRDVVRFQKQGLWKEADGALERATVRLGTGGRSDLRRQLDQARLDSDMAARIDTIAIEHAGSVAGILNVNQTDEAYYVAFRDHGFGNEPEDPHAVATRIKQSAIRTALIAALYDWSLCPQAEERPWLLEVISLSDDGHSGWHQRIRQPAIWNNGDALAAATVDAPVDEEAVPFLLAVSSRLEYLLKEEEKEVLPFLKRVQSAHPDDFWANLALGDAFNGEHKFAEAVRFYQSAVAIRPLAAMAYDHLGMAIFNSTQSEEGIAVLRRALQIDPGAFPSQANLAMLLVTTHHEEEAIPLLNTCLQHKPNDPMLHCLLGASFEGTNHPDEAITQYRAAIGFNPTYPLFYQKLHSILIRVGNNDEALATWQAQIRAIPNDTSTWEGYPEFCLHLKRQSDYENARTRQFEIFKDSRDAIICERVGRTCLLQPAPPEMLQKATEMIQHACERERGQNLYSYFLFSKGLAEYRANKFEAALATMTGEATLTYHPAPALVQAMAEHRLGHVDKARGIYAQAVATYNWNQPNTADHQFWMYEILRGEADALINGANASR